MLLSLAAGPRFTNIVSGLSRCSGGGLFVLEMERRVLTSPPRPLFQVLPQALLPEDFYASLLPGFTCNQLLICSPGKKPPTRAPAVGEML